MVEIIKYTRLLLAISVEELAHNPIKNKSFTLSGLMSDIVKVDWKKYLTYNYVVKDCLLQSKHG